MPNRVHFAIIFLGLTAFCATGFAQQASADREANALMQRVFARLLAVPAASRPAVAFDTWPPKAQIIDPVRERSLAESAGQHNAFAHAPDCIPQVRVTEDLMGDVIQGDPDRLALILGHELSHLLLGHLLCTRSPDRSSFAQAAFTRTQEFAADENGERLALAAGYSVRNGLTALQRLSQISDYSSFEALSKDHPSWTERLARLDGAQSQLWRSMSAFQDGAYFLQAENYVNAEQCFRSVAKEFPQADDAWANRGYALLMQYADKLTTADLRSFGIGQIVAGAFYSRPVWLSGKVRGIDQKTWDEAVSVLDQAEKLNSNLALVKANLGVAYLLSPNGKEIQRAISYLESAADLLRKDRSLAAQAESDPRTPVLAVANNLAVAYAAGGRVEEARALLQSVSGVGFRRSEVGFLQSEAFIYNYAMLIAEPKDAKGNKQAYDLLQQYLEDTSAGSSWWAIAYDKYVAICEQLSVPPKTQVQLQRATYRRFREIDSVDLGSGRVLTLGQRLSDLSPASDWKEVAVVNATSLRRLRSSSTKMNVLADTNQVLAILLVDPRGPSLTLQGIGADAKSAQLRVGMPAAEVDTILSDEPYRFDSLTDTWMPYRYYPYLGVAMMTGTDRNVSELVVVQTIRR